MTVTIPLEMYENLKDSNTALQNLREKGIAYYVSIANRDYRVIDMDSNSFLDNLIKENRKLENKIYHLETQIKQLQITNKESFVKRLFKN